MMGSGGLHYLVCCHCDRLTLGSLKDCMRRNLHHYFGSSAVDDMFARHGDTLIIIFFESQYEAGISMKKGGRIIWRQCDSRDTVRRNMSKPRGSSSRDKNKDNQCVCL